MCLRCGSEFTGKKGKLYCTDYCRRKAEKARWRERGAPARRARHEAWLAEQTPLWEASRARKAEIKAAKRAARPPPKPKRKRRLTLEERLVAHSVPEPNSGCLLWLGKVHKTSGYAQVWLNGRHRNAHRVAYEVAKGPVPEGMMVCHHCDNPACIEPAHLYAGTAQTNHDDMVRRSRARAAYTKTPRPSPKPKPSAWGRKRYAGMNI